MDKNTKLIVAIIAVIAIIPLIYIFQIYSTSSSYEFDFSSEDFCHGEISIRSRSVIGATWLDDTTLKVRFIDEANCALNFFRPRVLKEGNGIVLEYEEEDSPFYAGCFCSRLLTYTIHDIPRSDLIIDFVRRDRAKDISFPDLSDVSLPSLEVKANEMHNPPESYCTEDSDCICYYSDPNCLCVNTDYWQESLAEPIEEPFLYPCYIADGKVSSEGSCVEGLCTLRN